MRYRRLGTSDLDVSVIALGTWKTYGGAVERDQARRCIATALDAGINLIDTANVYSGGESESFLGEVLPALPRASFILATKVRFAPDGRPENDGLSATQVRKQLEASLLRLRLDYVDLYQLHRFDPATPLEETMAALTELVREGKIRHLGFSEFTPPQIEDTLRLARERGLEPFVSSQPQYSLLHRNPEAEVIPLCRRNGISQLVWSPLAEGVLTGKYRPGQAAPDDTRATSERMGETIGSRMDRATLERVQQLGPIAQALGTTVAQLALAWILREPNVASAIIGATRPSQVLENAAAAEIELGDEAIARVDALFPA